jgi:hypothetical protein
MQPPKQAHFIVFRQRDDFCDDAFEAGEHPLTPFLTGNATDLILSVYRDITDNPMSATAEKARAAYLSHGRWALTDPIGTHTLRKTFGCHACQSGLISPSSNRF